MSLLPLPVKQDLETKAVLKKLAQAHRALAELKGIITSIPNQSCKSAGVQQFVI